MRGARGEGSQDTVKLGAGGGCEKAAVRTVVAVPQVQVGEHQSGDTDQMAWRTGFAELESTRLRTLGIVTSGIIVAQKPILTCWNCFFGLLVVAIVIIIIHHGLPQKTLPFSLTANVPFLSSQGDKLTLPSYEKKKLTHTFQRLAH